MGLFDIFKKKKTESTFPENELEQLLMQGATSIEAQKAFYQKLLWHSLFVITGGHDHSQEGAQVSKEDTIVHFVIFENGHIPVFTSANRIFDKGIIKEEVPYLSLKGQDLFEVTKGATFIINPYSDYAKELIPAEIEHLVNGTIYDEIDKNEIEHKKQQAFNEIFERAAKNQNGLIFLGGYKKQNLSPSDKMKLEVSIQDFQKCLETVPNHWPSMVLMAKAFQRLERHTEALELLESAFTIELENHTIPLEASLEAMHLNDIDKALFYSVEALKRKPNDHALLGNYAMNLFLAQRDNEAKDTIEKAIEIQPNDSINKNIESIMRDVITGKRKRPTFEDIIQ